MRKPIAWILAVILALGCAGAIAEELPTPDGEAPLPLLYQAEPFEDIVGLQAGSKVTVGSVTEMAGVFATDLFGNNTADLDVRALLHGYGTVAWIRTLGVALDGVPVSDVVPMDLPNGGRSYTFTINNNLRYNNGMPITARDYVFSILLSISPEIAEIGGTQRDMDHIVGAAAYRAGAAETVTGIRLLGDYVYSMEVSAAYLPYFYGLAMLNVIPYPPSVIAPGCEIVDDGQGAYISGPYTAELLETTLLHPETGYVWNPRVTSGPYQLVSYNAQEHVAEFTVNPYYLGNFEWKKPNIETVVFKHVANEDMADALADGSASIINKVIDRQAWLNMNALSQQGTIGFPHAYPRSGFAYLAFACEAGPTASVSVRRAIALAIDQDAFVAEHFIEGMALPVYGYYGLGQWMIGMPIGEKTTEEGIVTVTAQEGVQEYYPEPSIGEAKALLALDGWKLNEEGEPYEDGVGIRYRQDGETLEPLTIKWAKMKDNETADALRQIVEARFAELGIGLEITELILSDMLPHYYRQVDREYDMFNLGSNFTYVFDPYYDYNTADDFSTLVNTSGLKDTALMNLAWQMRRTDARDAEAYVQRWFQFQQRWVDMMPMVPLYSNVYYDFALSDIQGYEIESFIGWAIAMPYVYISDVPLYVVEEDIDEIG